MHERSTRPRGAPTPSQSPRAARAAGRALSAGSPGQAEPAAATHRDPLDLPVTSLPNVGPARAKAFERLGVVTLRDLLLLIPRRLASAGEALPIAQARERVGAEVAVRGVIEKVTLARFGKRSTLRVTVSDASGSIVAAWFNQPWLRTSFPIGAPVELEGRVVAGPALSAPRRATPSRPLAAAGTLVPQYPEASGLGGELVGRACREVARAHAAGLVDPLPEEARARLRVPHLADAARAIHEPSSPEAFAAARRRVALESLLRFQSVLLERRRSRSRGRAMAVAVDDALDRELVARFPFALTAGQRAVILDLRRDLARTVPMRRLLQGDVGSGKTVLGLYAALAVARAGGQSAFLAPTELLAEQHFHGQRAALEREGLSPVLLTGSLATAERRAALAKLASGSAGVVFGTHALFSEGVRYRRLALAVIDEQQRFGVAQRAQILDKGDDVHVLLMTATPIPRTLALTLYGDLDASVLRDRPAGRGAVRTRWVRGHDRKRVPAFLRERLEAGDQVYWVVPRIGGEEEDLSRSLAAGQSSAELAYERLSRSELAAYGVELVHGRLPAHERAARLDRFRSGAVRVLVATTVVEVGVDVPQATVMVIENAERLGLAQLHQLRGRIGRGPKESWCLIFGTEKASERFLALERTSDGFEIAEEDLRRRGMGDLAGLRQAGENSEGLTHFEEDVELLLAARDLVAQSPEIAAAYHVPSGFVATP